MVNKGAIKHMLQSTQLLIKEMRLTYNLADVEMVLKYDSCICVLLSQCLTQHCVHAPNETPDFKNVHVTQVMMSKQQQTVDSS